MFWLTYFHATGKSQQWAYYENTINPNKAFFTFSLISENRKWGFQDKNDHFCRRNRFNPLSSFLQSSLELNHHLSTDRVSQIIQLALT